MTCCSSPALDPSPWTPPSSQTAAFLGGGGGGGGGGGIFGADKYYPNVE